MNGMLDDDSDMEKNKVKRGLEIVRVANFE